MLYICLTRSDLLMESTDTPLAQVKEDRQPTTMSPDAEGLEDGQPINVKDSPSPPGEDNMEISTNKDHGKPPPANVSQLSEDGQPKYVKDSPTHIEDNMEIPTKEDQGTSLVNVSQLSEDEQPKNVNDSPPHVEDNVEISTKEDQNMSPVNVSQLSAPDPSRSYLTSKHDVITVGKKYTSILQVINVKNKPCEVPIDSLECELHSEMTGYKARCSIERRTSPSQYDVIYKANYRGRHKLLVKVKGQHIGASPFSLLSTSSVESIGPPMLIIDVERPCGIAINHKRELVVTHCYKDDIRIFSPNGKLLRSFNVTNKVINYKRQVTIDDEDNILVADTNCIQKVTTDGRLLATVYTKEPPLRFIFVTDIAFNTFNSMVYVVDYNGRTVYIFNSDLVYVGFIGERGHGEGGFYFPFSIACDSDGNIYIFEDGIGTELIQLLTAEEKYLKTFGSHTPPIYSPQYIALGGNGYTYVSEGNNHLISVYNSDGKLVKSLGGGGDKLGYFHTPKGLAVDDDGVLYVCDYKNDRIQVF